MVDIKRVQYFVREKGESFVQMVQNHEKPYASYQAALEDAQSVIIEDELEEDQVEIVQVLVEDVFPVKLPKKKKYELGQQNS